MPIKNMTDIHTPGRGMERLGVLHKGAARTEADIKANRPGKDLDHLRIEFADERKALLPAWEALYGKQTREIRGAYLLAGDVDTALTSWLEEWGKSGLFHRCDGEIQTAWFDASLGAVNHEPRACQSATPGCRCKQIGRLNIFLPEFVRATGMFGYFMLQSHSVRDIKHIYHLLSDAQTFNGSLFGIPFVITRRPETLEVPELDKQTNKPTGKRMTITKSLLHISIDETYTQQQIAPRLLGGTDMPALIDPTTGEKQQALPPPKPVQKWGQADASKWAARQREEFGLSDRELLAALGVSRLGEWEGDAASATAALNEWLDTQLAEPEGEGVGDG